MCLYTFLVVRQYTNTPTPSPEKLVCDICLIIETLSFWKFCLKPHQNLRSDYLSNLSWMAKTAINSNFPFTKFNFKYSPFNSSKNKTNDKPLTLYNELLGLFYLKARIICYIEIYCDTNKLKKRLDPGPNLEQSSILPGCLIVVWERWHNDLTWNSQVSYLDV